jgi:hypothetical protein
VKHNILFVKAGISGLHFFELPVQKVNMSVDKRELLFLPPLPSMPILAKPVQRYGR